MPIKYYSFFLKLQAREMLSFLGNVFTLKNSAMRTTPTFKN